MIDQTWIRSCPSPFYRREVKRPLGADCGRRGQIFLEKKCCFSWGEGIGAVVLSAVEDAESVIMIQIPVSPFEGKQHRDQGWDQSTSLGGVRVPRKSAAVSVNAG